MSDPEGIHILGKHRVRISYASPRLRLSYPAIRQAMTDQAEIRIMIIVQEEHMVTLIKSRNLRQTALRFGGPTAVLGPRSINLKPLCETYKMPVAYTQPFFLS